MAPEWIDGDGRRFLSFALLHVANGARGSHAMSERKVTSCEGVEFERPLHEAVFNLLNSSGPD
jgi:hypothetical protein